MTQPLFRQQAIQHQRRGLQGDVLLTPQLSPLLLSGALLVWVIAMLIWLGTAHYARKETALGWLEPPEGVLRLYAKQTGVIQEVLVREGEAVKAGQPLLIIQGNNLLTSGEGLEQQLLQEAAQQQALLRERHTRNEQRHGQRISDTEQRLAAIEQELALLEQQEKTLRARSTLLQKQLDRQAQLLAAGHLSALDWDNSQQQALALETEQQTLARQRLQHRRLLDETRSEQAELPQRHADQQAALAAELSELSQQIAQLQNQQTQVISATQAGIVSNLRARPGQQVTSSQQTPLLTLNPAAASLSIQLLVPARAAGFVHIGQALDIRYDAFPYQKFGLYRGKVTQVSDTVLLPGELQQVPVPAAEPVYLVTAQLEQDQVMAFGRAFALKSGMTLSADIRLEERRLLHWLFEPLLSLRGRL